MSVAVLIGVHDGVVLAADSASTLTIPAPPAMAGQAVGNVYDNANKIFNLIKGEPLGCITFGSGNIGNASIATLIKDLRKKLTETPEELKFNIKEYSMEQVANILGEFLGRECEKKGVDNQPRSSINIGFLLGGYSRPGSLGESWSVEILQGVPQTPKKLRNENEAGISWGGQAEVLQRIVLGFSPDLFNVLAQVNKPLAKAEQLAQSLGPLLSARLQAPVVFAPMPIQDAIDLGRFLVHAAIMYSRFNLGPNIVGGPIEIAAITKHENFKWISRKHYYEETWNREPIHVVIDK